jgi:hypothetical protein
MSLNTTAKLKRQIINVEFVETQFKLKSAEKTRLFKIGFTCKDLFHFLNQVQFYKTSF